MSAWLAQFISFISSDTGNLTYRLVLAFSIAIALNQSLGIQSPAGSTRRRRTLIGLGLLLTLQLALFVISGLTWQGLIDGRLILPPLDRLVSLLSLLIIVWMWCLPDQTSVGDTGALIPALVILIGAVASTLWWSEQPTQLNYNGVLWDSIASIFGVVLGLLGVLFLLVLRPPEFGYGVAMLGIEAAGFGLHLAMLPYGNDYPSALRLAQMIAYPMLGLLAQRLPIAALSDPKSGEPDAAGEHGKTSAITASGKQEIIPAYADPAIWQTLTRLVAETDPERIAREVALTLTQAFGADICALIVSPDATGNFSVQFAYDRVHHRFIESRTIQGSLLPVISSAWRMGRNRRLSASAASPDLNTVAQTFGLEVVNSLLFQPVLTADGKPGAGVLLLSLDPGKDWDSGEQEFAGLLARTPGSVLAT